MLRARLKRPRAVERLNLVDGVHHQKDLSTSASGVDEFSGRPLVDTVVALVGADEIQHDLRRAQRVLVQGIVLYVELGGLAAIIIDAMDLMYSKNTDGFALMTSDSDFTQLVMRTLESGLPVFGFGFGFGERKPQSAANSHPSRQCPLPRVQ